MFGRNRNNSAGPGDPPNPNPPAPNDLVPCPRGCGYRLPYSKYGAAHKITDPNDPNNTIWCK